MQSLTKRRIDSMWINHTGHNKSPSYGTSTREWQLDTVKVQEGRLELNAVLSVIVPATAGLDELSRLDGCG